MRIQKLTEAKYANFQRGSIEWVLKTFFDDQHEQDTDLYRVKSDFICIYLNQYLVDLVEISHDKEVFIYPLIGEARRYSYRQGSLADQLIIFKKDRVHPR